VKQIDILRGSKEVKRLIVDRSFQFKIPLKYICTEIGIDYRNFMLSYINSDNMDNCTLTEEQFIDILKVLGVTVRMQLVIDKDYDGLEERTKLMNKHG